MKQKNLNFHRGAFSKTFNQHGVLFSPTSLFVLSQCVCVPDCDWARLHCNDALAAVARAIVLIPSLNVLIHCENESENGRLRERERIIMFPLLSRLPQLSLKRGSQSTCLLIHLKLSNNRTPPPMSLSPSLSPLTHILSLHLFLPLFSHFSISNFYS